MIPCHTTQFVVIRLCDGSCLVVIQHIEPDEVNRIIDSQQLQLVYLILEGTKKKKLQEGMRGGGGQSDPPLFFKFLSIVTGHLIGFHGNHSNIMTSLVAAILDFQIFNFFSYSNLNTENSAKTTFSDWNLQICKIHCKVISI